MARVGLGTDYQVHDSLQVAGRLTATVAEHAQLQRPDATTANVLTRLRTNAEAA